MPAQSFHSSGAAVWHTLRTGYLCLGRRHPPQRNGWVVHGPQNKRTAVKCSTNSVYAVDRLTCIQPCSACVRTNYRRVRASCPPDQSVSLRDWGFFASALLGSIHQAMTPEPQRRLETPGMRQREQTGDAGRACRIVLNLNITKKRETYENRSPGNRRRHVFVVNRS